MNQCIIFTTSEVSIFEADIEEKKNVRIFSQNMSGKCQDCQDFEDQIFCGHPV